MSRVQAGSGENDPREGCPSRYDVGEGYVVDCQAHRDEEDDVPWSAERVLTIYMPWTLGAIVVILVVALVALLKYR